MDVLGINGSPRPEGNSAYALRYSLSRLEEAGLSTRYVALAGKTIQPCDGCWVCRTGPCVYDDDMTEIRELLRKCRFLVLASPVYMGMVTGQMKVMMDRSVALRVREGFELSGKTGAGIACGGFRNEGQELTLQNMHTFFMQQDMAAVADGPRFSHSGATIVGEAETDEVGLETIRNLCDKIISVLQSISGDG